MNQTYVSTHPHPESGEDSLIEASVKAFLATKTHEEIRRRAEQFSAQGYTKFALDELVPPQTWRRVVEETECLLSAHTVRRDVTVAETDHSKRAMSNVVASSIRAHGQVIPCLYHSSALRAFLGKIVGDTLVDCWEQEHFLINLQERVGDTHGWHWGDYPYTVIWVLDAPPIEFGGMLQCIPHTTWDKSRPSINRYIVDRSIRSYYHASGEAYLLRSDTTLHRVVPLNRNARRVILNTCWASARDERAHVDHGTMQLAFV